jgi:hypothetical protein
MFFLPSRTLFKAAIKASHISGTVKDINCLKFFKVNIKLVND